MDAIISMLSSGGLIVFGAYVGWFITKKYSELQQFIQEKLLTTIENNTRVMEHLIQVINEMRHEIKDEFKNMRDKIC